MYELERPVEAGCVRAGGAVCWVVLGLLLFCALLGYVPVSGITDAPAYARSILWLSLGYHLDDTAAYVYSTSPPPPVFL